MSIKIGIVGLGTVGGGVYKLLKNREELISARVGCGVEIKKACDKRRETKEELGIADKVFTTDYNEVIEDKEISLVVVLTGDSELAYTIISNCFKKSKHVVTANKALLATRWKEIFKLARENGCLIYFEASVGSGIPVIQGINEGLAANRIKRIEGILNGTTNYILTRMSKDSSSFKEANKAAIEAGFAEPDSSADIDGLDAAYKICVLANIIFKEPVKFDQIHCEGIRNLQLQDIKFAKEMFNFNIKLIAVIKKHENGTEIRVHPAFLQEDDMLSGVNYENNGILVEGDTVGEVMFYGKGAGRFPAASAVVSDIIFLAQKINYKIAGQIPYIHTEIEGDTNILDIKDLEFQYYVRFTTVDKPGVLSKIAGILGNNNVSIASCFQKTRTIQNEVPIVVVTHMAKEGDLKKALLEIDPLDIIKKKTVLIRIESEKETL